MKYWASAAATDGGMSTTRVLPPPRQGEVQAPVEELHLPADTQYPSGEVNLLRGQTEHFTLPRTAAQGHHHRDAVPLVDRDPDGAGSISQALRDEPAAAGTAAEAAGVNRLSVMDHYFQMEFNGGAEAPMLAAYTTLAYLAAHASKTGLVDQGAVTLGRGGESARPTQVPTPVSHLDMK